MNEQDWTEWKRLYADYQEARPADEAAEARLRGAFSELAQHFDNASLAHNWLYEEQQAHHRFQQARERLHAFLKEKSPKKDA